MDADDAYEAALRWLPFWTARQKGFLRSLLIRAENVSSAAPTAEAGSKAVRSTPLPTEMDSDPLTPSQETRP